MAFSGSPGGWGPVLFVFVNLNVEHFKETPNSVSRRPVGPAGPAPGVGISPHCPAGCLAGALFLTVPRSATPERPGLPDKGALSLGPRRSWCGWRVGPWAAEQAAAGCAKGGGGPGLGGATDLTTRRCVSVTAEPGAQPAPAPTPACFTLEMAQSGGGRSLASDVCSLTQF